MPPEEPELLGGTCIFAPEVRLNELLHPCVQKLTSHPMLWNRFFFFGRSCSENRLRIIRKQAGNRPVDQSEQWNLIVFPVFAI